MFLRILCTLAVSMALILSCSDEITNNYYQNTNGAVFGNVVPADSGVAKLVGLREVTTTIDADGLFNFADVPPGKYVLEIHPQNYSKRVLKDIVVGTGVTTQRRDTPISELPFPIYSLTPTDGATEVYTFATIRIRADENLNLEELNELTTFTPAVAGTWKQGYDSYEETPLPGSYYYELSTEMEPITSYQMTISGDVHYETGATLGEDLIITFETREYPVRLNIIENRLSGRVSRHEFRASLNVYRCVDVDSAAMAIRFEPEIAGVWVPSDDYGNCVEPNAARYHDFLPSELPLLKSTSYKAIIDGRPIGSNSTDTIEFVSEGYEVIDVRPTNGYYGVPADNQILVIFNEPMDTVSARLAFSVTRVGGEQVPGTFSWNAERTDMTFSHYQNLYASGTYKIKVTTGAKLETGEFLDVGWESYFLVL